MFIQLACLGARAALSVLKFVKQQFLCEYSFDWSRVGGDTPPPVEFSKPNLVSFQSVSEEHLGYYRCEVREAGKVVLTVYRALYKDESTKSIETLKPIAG